MLPVPLRVVEANARAYRRTWKGSAVTSFLGPILFLAAMGLGLGTLVHHSTRIEALSGFSYLAFIAPGLMAAMAMQTAAVEGTWPVMAGMKWIKTFHAALATPVEVSDLVLGYLLWVGIRVLMAATAFAIVMMLFRAVPVIDGLAGVGPAVLTGMAFAAPIVAFTSWIDRETKLSTLFRFGIMPMFLFSGTFFPVDQLPGWLQPVAYATPLWHGVELTRAAVLHVPEQVSAPIHVAYLVALIVVGYAIALKGFERKLQP
ncbi:MAG: lipooligosaccharide transport system permease protein [Actinomycetota bacterium]|nr:lipooligosaccharide transport system permease protein [Actinomycetota bacterium]